MMNMNKVKEGGRSAGRTGQQFGNYRLVAPLGQGRFSETYLGEHVQLKTQCVVKVLKTRLMDEVLKSFLDETRMLAQLQHPHIVRVLDAGIERHLPFLVMDYMPNGALRQRFPEGTPQPLTAILPYARQIAEALQFMHERGFIHENVRPENMLLGWSDEVSLSDCNIPAVTKSRHNWGSKEVTGTIAYLAPEQIKGKSYPASDQYALALVIYEWLSGNHPFRGSFIEIAGQQMNAALPPLRQGAGGVPAVSPVVERVLQTALAKNPKQRFPGVMTFIETLEEVSGVMRVPVQAAPRVGSPPPNIGQNANPQYGRPQGPSPQHNPALAPTGAAPYQPVVASAPFPASRRNTPAPTPAAQPKGRVSRRKFMLGLAGLAALGVGGTALALSQKSLLSSFTSGATPTSSAGSTPGNDSNGAQSSKALPQGTTIFTYRGHTARINAVAWSPDGKQIASASDDTIVQVCDGASGATIYTYPGHAAEVYGVAWSPDGKYIASAGEDATVQVWSAASGKRILTYRGHSNSVNAVAWSPDGRFIASASDDHTVQVWNAVSGKQFLTYGEHTLGVLAVAWSPDGRRIASGSWDTTVQFWNAATGDILLTYGGHSKEVYSLAWSPDGKRLASASADTAVQVCDTRVGTTLFTYHGHNNIVLAVGCSLDGKYMASAGYDDTVQIWNAANGKHIYTYPGHSNWVSVVAWSPDGKRIASAGYDDTMQVWQAI